MVGLGRLGKKGESIKKYKLPVIKRGTGNRVNILITLYKVSWVLDLSGDHFVKLHNCLITMLYA